MRERAGADMDSTRERRPDVPRDLLPPFLPRRRWSCFGIFSASRFSTCAKKFLQEENAHTRRARKPTYLRDRGEFQDEKRCVGTACVAATSPRRPRAKKSKNCATGN